MATIDINIGDFAEKVLKSDKYVLVDFWAPWCMPCRMMSPVLEELSEDTDINDKITFAKINTEEPQNQYLAISFNIQSIPNLKLFKDGKVIKEFIGLQDKDILRKYLLQEAK